METLFLDDALEQTEALNPAEPVGRQKDDAHAVTAAPAQPNPGSGRDLRQEAVRNLNGQTRAVAGVLLRTGRAAVLQVEEDGERIANDRVRRAAGDVHDEAEAASVVLEGRVVQTLSSWTAGVRQLGFHPRFRLTVPARTD